MQSNTRFSFCLEKEVWTRKSISVWLEVVTKVVHFVLIYQFGFVLKIIINKTSNNQRLQSAGDNRLRAVSLFLQI